MEFTTDANDVREIAERIVQEHRPELEEHVSGIRIQYMFQAEATALGEGRVCAGKCVHCSDRDHALHGYDFLIVMARDVWDEATPEYRLALVDHELAHVGLKVTEEGEPAYDEVTGRRKGFCRRHEIEDFSDVIERHGTYHRGLVQFLAAFGNRELLHASD